MTSGVRIAVIAGALHPACCAPRDASFGETPSAALNVTAALRRCGDSHASGRMELPLSSEDFVCAAQCHESEPGLHEAFEPWWDHKLHPHVFREFCDRVAENDINHRRVAPLFVVTFAIHNNRILAKCCTDDGACQRLLDGITDGDSGAAPHEELLQVVVLLQELIDSVTMGNFEIAVALGDEAFTDKSMYAPIPLFHAVRSTGHWTIP